MSNENKYGQELLLQCLTYDKETGLLYHNPDRPKDTFSTQVGYSSWKTRFSGNIVSYTNPMGYVIVQLQLLGKRRQMFAHRVIWCMNYGPIPDGMYIDHINGNKADNRLENLRVVPHADNMKNKTIYKNNKTGYAGVYPYGKKFVSSICTGGKQKHIGVFNCVTSAAVARAIAERQLGFHENHGRM